MSALSDRESRKRPTSKSPLIGSEPPQGTGIIGGVSSASLLPSKQAKPAPRMPSRERQRLRRPTSSSGGSKRGKVAYMCVADSIDLEALAVMYRASDYQCTIDGEVLHVTNVKGYGSIMEENETRFDLFVFGYGSLVWWGTNDATYRFVECDFLQTASMPREARSLLKDRYQQKTIEELFPSWLHFRIAEDDEENILENGKFLENFQKDDIILPSDTPAFKQTISHALAQTAKLDVIEPLVADLLRYCKPLPLQLSMKGSADISSVKVNQLKGELFLYRMILREVLDEPDFFWEYSWFLPLYSVVREDYAIETRVSQLEEKLTAVHEILQMLAAQFSQEHNNRLEWIVIMLIVAAVLIAVFQLWIQVRRILLAQGRTSPTEGS